MILANTSAWVEFDRATDSPVDERLTHLISRGRGVAVTEPVIAEVVAGARTDQREVDLRRLMLRFELLPFDSVTDFDGAVDIYRTCRQAGLTPRGLLDCMIAAVAIRNGVAVLAQDTALARIAELTPLRLDTASLH